MRLQEKGQKNSVRDAMQFTLTGFTSESGFRVFGFRYVRSDRSTVECKVKADLAVARRYGISVQELPLLCRGILERSGQEPEAVVEFTEGDARQVASRREADRQAESSRRAFRKQRTTPAGAVVSPWRTKGV
ncbi:MAG: hypothetical protein HYX27_09840 [Acidobacteria bacterium]|nr:hypothetical protein [Acidobacteriota bacterium]